MTQTVWRGAAARILAVAVLSSSAVAQVPSPVHPLATRRMHPSIAPTTGATVLNGSGPLFQYPDQSWNHGEGFSATVSDVDQGGWFNEDDGSGVTAADIHKTYGGWQPFVWTSPVHPNSGQTIRRFVGYLRPSALPLPTSHPLYGPLPPTGGPFHDGTYVDQGAFELFAPLGAPPSDSTKIVVVVNTWETTTMASALGGKFGWSLYEGYFSPDGLKRPEKGPTRSLANFLANDNDADVIRASVAASVVANASYLNATYWPIGAYAVQCPPGRQTTLNEQRQMQLRQAILLLLQQSHEGNPLYPQVLTAAQVEQRVVVVFAGGSNGGLQASFAAMRHPDKVHGVYSDVLNPSLQRMFNEHVMNADTLNQVWRTHVPGSAGCFNAIRVSDLNNDGYKELYVAGSFGLWRFTQPGEVSPP